MDAFDSIRASPAATCGPPIGHPRVRRGGPHDEGASPGAVDAARQAPQLEQARRICAGGHLTEPYEQNTQQSPALGRSTVLQRSHS